MTTEATGPRTQEELAEMLAAGNAPVKRQFLRPWVGREKKDKKAAAAGEAQGEDAAGGADANANANGDGDGGQGDDRDGDRGGRGGRSGVGVGREGRGRGGRLSTRQRKRERQEKKNNAMCSQFLSTGACKWGADGGTCKYSHDTAAFLASKMPDLPGTCPFAALATGCPHGMACRYYRTHPSAEPAPKPADAPATAEAEMEVVALPVPEKIEKEINFFSKDTQHALRRRTYKFPAADAVLKELGVQCIKDYRAEDKPAAAAAAGAGAATDADATTTAVEEEEQAAEAQEAKRAKVDDSVGAAADTKEHLRERKLIDFSGKLYLAPLTTLGNLPYRRLCKRLGADITCGEMAMCTNLLQGQQSEWALLRKHPEEDLFGIQVCGGYADTVARCMEVLQDEVDFDFVDINMGCPIDLVCNKGAGSSLLRKTKRIEQIVRASSTVLTRRPMTIKTRIGWEDNDPVAHTFFPRLKEWGAAACTLHGRTRAQRYSRLADWDYIGKCVDVLDGSIELIGNGDIFSYQDYEKALASGVKTVMVARGALIKPWVFTEIKEKRDWDISGSERFDLLKTFCSHGLEHWGSDQKGVETTRRFLLEWLSFLHRYIPVGLLEVVPQKIHWRPPGYVARDDREALLSSGSVEDWVKISTMLLGPTPDDFNFVPKHKSNAYSDTTGPCVMEG